MTRKVSSPLTRWALFALSFLAAVAAAMAGGGAVGQRASAAEGDGSFVLCKQYWVTGPSIDNFKETFGFVASFEVDGTPLPEASVAVEFRMFEGSEECTEPIVIPAGADVTVTETLEQDWDHVPSYPRSVLAVDGVADDLVTGSNIATVDGGRCVNAACVLTFKNKRDETLTTPEPPLVDPAQGTLSVCKEFIDNGDDHHIGPTAFTFLRSDKFRTSEFPIGPFIPEGGSGCIGLSALDAYPGDTVTLTELPFDGFTPAPGYPQVELHGPNGFAARSGNSVTIDLLACSEASAAGDVAANVIDGEVKFNCSVTFYNRAIGVGERGSIRVQKVTREIVDGVPAETADHAGWTFTLRSNDCETIKTGVTDQNGFVQWDDLGLCPDYSVTENTESVPFEGYEPVDGGVVAGIQPGLDGVTEVVIINERQIVSEPCTDCSVPEPNPDPNEDPTPVIEDPTPVVEEPTPDPVVVEPDPTPVVVLPDPSEPAPSKTVPPATETPVPTATTEPVTPTPEATAEPPQATVAPVETVAGVVTVGPQPTPIPPSTGSGAIESDGGRLAISLGLAVLSFAFFIGGLSQGRRRTGR